MLKDDERKKKEAEELKEQKKAERECKKKEREEKKKEIQERRRKREAKKGKGKKQDKGNGCKRPQTARLPRAHRRICLDSSSDSDTGLQENGSESDSSESESGDKGPGHSPEPGPSSHRPRHRVILPARFQDDSGCDDGVICEICHQTEPEGVAGDTMFWVDCDLCGVWVHNYCAFKKNDVTRKLKCKNCSED